MGRWRRLERLTLTLTFRVPRANIPLMAKVAKPKKPKAAKKVAVKKAKVLHAKKITAKKMRGVKKVRSNTTVLGS